jgi:hypothetical protein
MADKKTTAAPSSDRNEDAINFDAKAMLLKNGEKKTVIRYTDRMWVEYVKDTLYNKTGKISHTSKVKGLELIAQGIAKEYKKPEAKE